MPPGYAPSSCATCAKKRALSSSASPAGGHPSNRWPCPSSSGIVRADAAASAMMMCAGTLGLDQVFVQAHTRERAAK
eukprot:6857230-Prymnesium_polylepis.1